MSLTDTASFSRKAFRWILIFLGAVIAVLFLFIIGRALKNIIFPPSPLPPTAAFGKLPKLDFSEGVSASNNINFSIETISGDLPVLVDRAKVFRISQGGSTFGGVEKIKERASRLNFDPNPQGLSGNIYQFTDSKEVGRILSIDVATANFVLDSEFYNQTKLISQNAGNEKEAVDSAYEFFTPFNFDPIDFPKDTAKTRMLRIDGPNLVEVPSVANANVIEVSFSRSEIDKFEVITPNLEKLPTVAYVSKRKIVRAKLNKQDIRLNEFGTYPLRGTQDAFGDLTAGKGAFNKQPVSNNFAIREVKLGYLENEGAQEYLQPVYLFKSDDGLIAYVSAVSDAWLN